MKEILVAFLICMLCQATATESCNVTIKMTSTNPVKVGESLTISCSLVNACENETVQWMWYYNNSAMEEIRVDMNGSGSSTSYDSSPLGMDNTGVNTSYVISRVKESHNGTYKCVANINGSLYMDSILLTVKDTNVIKVQVHSQELKYSSDGMISCFISLNTAIGPNTSDLIVMWYHNYEQINRTMDLQQLNATHIERNITINNIQLEDAGNYTCNVSIGNDDYVMDTQSVCVFGFFSIESSSHTNLMVGSKVEIQCGNVPGVTYTWRGPNNKILPDPLIISSVSISDDQSTYSCIANISTNLMNCQTEEESIALDVLDTFVENVTITTSTIIAGNHDTIICEVYLSAEIGPDISSLSVEWYHNGINVNSHYSIMKLKIISGILFINVVSSNAGTYTCSVVIRGGNTKNSTKDVCVNYPKLFVDPYTNLILGSNTIINCRAMYSILSDISVYWIDSNNIEKQNPLVLSPVVLSDNNTIYTCFISIHQNPNSCIPQNHTIEITIKDTFVKEITIFPINFIIGTPGILMCGIVLNIESGPDVASLLVEWYHNNNSIINNTLGYIVSSLAKRFAKEFNSTLKISQIEASHSGNYTCVARIGEENQKKSLEEICVNYQQPIVSSSSYTGLTLGDNVNIPCTSQELKESEVTVTWIDPNNHTLQNPLMLSPVSVSHNNTRYTCNVRIHDNPSSCENKTQDINITIKDTYVAQVIITPAKDTKPNNLLVGQLAVVSCMIDINTNIGPDMSSFHKEWYHNNEIITTDLAQRGDSLQLQLKKVKTSLAGYYECIAWIDDNTLRNKSDNILLYVNLPTPLVTIDYQNLQVYNTSTSLDLTCSASISSSESPYVNVFTSAVFEWRYIRGGSEFSKIFLTSQNNLKIHTSSLSLHNFNLSSAGEYTCDVYLYSNFSFVKNSTRKSDKTNIRIKVPTPVIILNTNGTLYNVGNLLILHCKIILRRENIDVNTMATIKLYNKDILRETRMIPVVTEGENLAYHADFHFSNIKLSDSGIYKCQGFVDDDINSSIIIPSDVVEDYITINVKIPTPEINLNTSDVYYDVGSSLVLSCQMILLSGNIDNDTIAVFELKSNFADFVLFSETSVPQVMSETKFIYTVFFLFNALKLSSAGEYTCTGIIDDAMNSSFIIQSNKTVDSGSIFIKMPTGSPINCTNTTFLPRTVTLVWIEPEKALQNGEISGYYLECRIDSSETQIPDVNITQDNPDTNYTIPVLIPFTTYRCLLTTINQVGQGPSTMCVFTTAQDIPENAPENVSSAPSTFNITFTWLPPSIPNGIIIQYNLTVDNINTGTTITHVINSTQDHYTVGDFKPYQRYSASLSAGTVAGYGPAAYVSGRTEPDIPGAVSTINVNVLNINTIQITWSPVPQEETNGNITHYIVSVSLYEGRELYNRDISVSIDLQVIVNGLTGEIPYGVTVKAVNDIGQEGQSNTTVFFTRENVPPIPTNISVLRLNGTHMNISWSLVPITKARGFIQSYFILYRQIDNRKRLTLSVSVPATDSSVVIGELDPGKSYSVLISASTNAGQGAFTSEVVVEESKSLLFQLRAEPFTSCEEWTISTENSIKSFIRSAVVDIIQDYCECGFLDSFITNETLFCDTQNPTQAVYRAKLFNFGSISSTQIVSWIEDWVLNGASVTIGLVLVTFDPTCPVPLNSINDGICELPADMSTSTPTIVTRQSTSSVGVIAGSAFAVVFIVLICIVLIIIVIFYFHLKSKKGRLHVTGNDEKNPGDVNIELESNKAYSKVGFPPDETVDHTYESLENYENVGRDDVPPELNGDTSNQPVANVN